MFFNQKQTAMKKLFTLSLLLLLTGNAIFSQMLVARDVDTRRMSKSAMLEIRSNNRGLLIPRIALEHFKDTNSVKDPAVSLMVFTFGTPGLARGFYYWNGSQWERFTTGLEGAGSDTLSNIFIGTQSGSSNTTGASNTAFGYFSLKGNTTGTQNAAFGANALTANTTGRNNTASGAQALAQNTAGNFNTANGRQALFANVFGSENTATGNQALASNTNGSTNTAYGSQSMFGNTTGGANTATGANSLKANTSGGNNTANGESALLANTNGFGNSAVGLNSLRNNTTGNDNTAVGIAALRANTTGSKNTAIGALADVNAGVFENSTAIGYGAIVNGSNLVQIGNSAITNVYFGNGTATLHGNLATPSDKRFKYNIKSNVPGLDFITKLQPVTYSFDKQKLDEYAKTGVINDNLVRPASYTGETFVHTGFLAQDVERIARELGYDFDGVKAPKNDKDFYKVSYSQFIMPLVKSVQEQQSIIEDQNKKIAVQEQQLIKLQEQVEELAKAVKAISNK
jgi:hypothetical protein